MARRAGKAASRKARQRRVQRAATPPRTTPAATPEADATPVATAPEPVRATAPAPRRGILARQAVGSQLTASERSEYHYVERDLRDIAILTALMAALLFVAWLAVRGLGIVG